MSRLWTAADELRANSRLKSSEYPVPVFLRYADHKVPEAARKPAARMAENVVKLFEGSDSRQGANEVNDD